MRALLMKDLYVLLKQMRIFFLMILFFTLIPNTNMASFAVVYAGMLPFSALAYDEQSKWDQLAVTMPYSRRELVLSKYVLGYLACGAALLLCMGITWVCDALKLPLGNTFAPGEALLMGAIGPVFVAVTLPLMYRLGVEKGRMITLLAIGLVVGGMVGLLTLMPEELTQVETQFISESPNGIPMMPEELTQVETISAVVIAAAWGVSIALNVVSIWLSEKWYGYRNR